MKTFAIYDKTGKIKKIISTSRKDIIEKNLSKDHEYIEVDPSVKTGSHQVIDGQVVKDPTFVPKQFSKKKPAMSFTQSFGVTEKDIDACKDIESLKVLLKKMIAPQVIQKGI